MADKSLSPPVNRWVGLINIILDNLIKGFGAKFTVAAATNYAPWLGFPIIRDIFGKSIELLANSVDTVVKNNADIVVIRFQNDLRKTVYDTNIGIIQNPGASNEDIKNALQAIDGLINRNKP